MLKYKIKLCPPKPAIAMILCLIVVVGQFLVNEDFSLLGFMVAYIGAIAVLILFIGHKLIKKTKMVKPEEADLSQGFAVENENK